MKTRKSAERIDRDLYAQSGSKNLQVMRGKPAARWRRQDMDVAPLLRRVAIVVAGSLLLNYARRRGTAGRVAALGATVLVARAIQGIDDLGTLGCSLGLLSSKRCGTEHALDNAIEESFPASDAPSWQVATPAPQ